MAEWTPIWKPGDRRKYSMAAMAERQANREHAVEQDERRGIGGWWYFLALILPIFGGLAGIYWLAKGQVGPGLALWGTAFLGFVIGIMLLL